MTLQPNTVIMSGTGMGRHFDVFLSHNSKDKPAVEYIARLLLNEGFKPWLDKWELVAGRTWQDTIEQVLPECRACSVLFGPHGPSPWFKEELQIANRVRVERGDYSVIPVLLPGSPTTDGKDLPAFLANVTWVRFDSLDDPAALRRLISGISGVAPGFDPAAGAIVPEGCPYRGLHFFDVEHKAVFFGREILTDRLLAAIRPVAEGPENRFLAVSGPSGSGKSSLARAGLLARIHAGVFPESNLWPAVIVRPGAEPTENLAAALLKQPGFSWGSKPTELAQDLAAGKKTLRLAAASLLKTAPQRRVVLLVDQFEELFSLCEEESQREAFIENLVYASTIPDGEVIVILTMRSDFSGHCAHYRSLATAMSQPGRQFLISPMAEDELERSIQLPASLAGRTVEQGVVEHLITFAKAREGALPLVQDALYTLWMAEKGSRLTLDAYKKMGGVEGALGRRAENLYQSLAIADRQLCRRIFLRLIQPLEGGGFAKRKVGVAELMPAGSDEGMSRNVRAVLATLAGTEGRLIVMEGAPSESGTDANVELIHEALLGSWKTLGDWLADDQEFHLWRRRLQSAKEEWKQLQKHPDLLLRGPPLAEAQRWIGQRQDDLNEGEQEFIRASIAAADARKKAEARAATILRVLSAGLAVGFLIAIVLAWIAWDKARVAEAGRLVALAPSLIDHPCRVQLALEAIELSHSSQTEAALHLAVQSAGFPALETVEAPPVNAVAYSPDGRRIATAHSDGLVRLWDPEKSSPLEPKLEHPQEVLHLAFASAQGVLASASRDGVVRVWDASSGELRKQFPAEEKSVVAVGFNSAGDLLAAACSTGTVKVWRWASAELIRQLPGSAPALALVLHPSRNVVAAGYASGAVALWNIDTNEKKEASLATDRINSLAFTPDGARLAVAAGTAVLLVDSASLAQPRTLGTDPDDVNAVAVDPAGELLAAAGGRGTLRIIEAGSGREVLALVPKTVALTSLAFQPNPTGQSKKLAVGDRAGAVRIYEMNREALIAQARSIVGEARGKGLLPSEGCDPAARGNL